MNVENLPPFTTVWIAGALALSALEKLEYVSRYQLFYSSHLVFRSGQYWRLLTSFMYFGPFSGFYLFHLLVTMRYSYMLEMQTYGTSRRADYAWLLLISSLILLGLSSFISMPFLGDGLSYVLMYIWSRKSRHVRMGLFGLLIFSAPYQPYVFTAINWALKGFDTEIVHDFAGIMVGQLGTYYVSHSLFLDGRLAK